MGVVHKYDKDKDMEVVSSGMMVVGNHRDIDGNGVMFIGLGWNSSKRLSFMGWITMGIHISTHW